MNTSDASNSFSPCTLLKRALERIHISKGMLSIRVSVMDLGRFTTRQAAGAGNHFDYPPLVNGTQWTEGLIPRGETGSRTVTGFGSNIGDFAPDGGVRGHWLFRGRGHLVSFRLFRDDHVLDLVVGCLRNDLLANKVNFSAIRPAIDDFLRIGIAYTGQFLQLIGASAIDVEFVCHLGGGGCRARCLRISLTCCHPADQRESEDQD